MAKIEKFEDIAVWRDARSLVKLVYETTREGLFSKDYGLKDQIQRAAVSIMSNTAEGFERRSPKEFIQFLFIAKASAGEVRSLSYVAFDLNYADETTFNTLHDSCTSISKQISGFIKYLRNNEPR